MKAKTLFVALIAVAMLAMAPLGLSAKTLGMVADNSTASVTVFDADTHAVLGTVFIAPGDFTGDVIITPDLKRGFVTNLNDEVFVIDLTTSPPSLAGGTNPISISNTGVDLSVSPNGKFLLVSGSSDIVSISVIDIAAQAVISTFSTGFDTNSVDVCNNGSVLATSFFGSATVRRLTLSGTGTLTDTGEVLSISDPVNVYCAPGAQSGVVVRLQGVTSFTIPGLSPVDTGSLSGFEIGINGAINLPGNRVFVRSPGSVDVFSFTQATGALGASPLLTFSAAETSAFSGAEQIALHPNGGKLFVSEASPSAVNVYNPVTGVLIASITDPTIVAPTGVAVVTQADPCAGSPPPGAIVGTNGSNQINGTSGNDVIFGLGGNDQINGNAGDDLICGGAGNDRIIGNTGNDQIVGGSGGDQINGNAGDDTLNSQDGVNGNDAVSGGPGNDTCVSDPRDALSSCNP